ncbi:MAG TPA: MarR family winged helix-turn-helix transcriptional regulator [Acidimicrobiales bacterium]|nr:MarR family winged helix-turn-helix transcriptional regulator [Acidimicrobiales bacterium]
MSRPRPNATGASSLLIAQLARGMRRRIEQAVAPTGLRPRELLALEHLRERGPSPQTVLVELIGVDATNLVAVLNTLEDSGLIERRRDRSDRRRAIIELTPRGDQVLADLDRQLCLVDDEVFAPLTLDERRTLNELLFRVVATFGSECGEPCAEDC